MCLASAFHGELALVFAMSGLLFTRHGGGHKQHRNRRANRRGSRARWHGS
jgi:hypothetical protein